MNNSSHQAPSNGNDGFYKSSTLTLALLTIFTFVGVGFLSIDAASAQVIAPPPANTCISADTTAGTPINSFGVPFGGEFTLQQVLNNAIPPYTINTATDETGFQEWSVPLNTISVNFVGKIIANIAGNPNAFGYYVNDDLSTFVPLWKTSATHSTVAPVLTAGTPFVFSVPTIGVTSIGFAIDDQNGSTHTIYATQSSLNTLSEDHAVVYNPTDNTYVMGFEDLPLTTGDKDYQDAVMEIKVTGCAQLATECISGQNLLQNGGFETPVVTASQGWDVFGHGTTGLGWGVDWMPTAIGAPILANLELQTNVLGWTAKSGTQYAELDTDWDAAVSGEKASAMIYEDIATIPGKTYNLKFSFSPRPATDGSDNMMDVLWGGAPATSTSASGIGNILNVWKDYSMDVVATTTLTRLAFADTGVANSLGVFLDDVSLSCESCLATSGFIESDTQTTLDNGDVNLNAPAMLLTTTHPAWTADVDGASTSAKWIWSEDPVTQADTQTDTTKTFVRNFTVLGTPSAGQLTIAADNTYKVWVNGAVVGSDTGDNYSLTGQDMIDVTANLIVGSNTLKIEVTNTGVDGSDAASNPAGLLYSLVWSAKDCRNGGGGGGPNDPDSSVIYIQKFIDGSVATTGSFDINATLSWGAGQNFIGGVGQLNVGNSYTTQTVALTDGMNSATLAEVSGGTSNVIANGGACEIGKYRVVGYTQGTSFADAANAGATTTGSAILPNNFSSDQYVIVWNELCTSNGTGPQETVTYATTTIFAANLAPDLPTAATSTQWFFYDDTLDVLNNNLGSFVSGPVGVVLGVGSAQMTASGSDRINLATYQYKDVKLADIKALRFSTYSQSAGNGSPASERSAYLGINVDFDNSDTWQRRLIYLPSANGIVVNDTWQNWDALESGNASWTWSGYAANGNLWPDGIPNEYRSWASIVAAFPQIQTRSTDSWMGLRVGEPYPDGFTGNADNFVIAIKTGNNTHTQTFDFEPNTKVGIDCVNNCGGGGTGGDGQGSGGGTGSSSSGGGSGNRGGNSSPIPGLIAGAFNNATGGGTNPDGEVLGESVGLPNTGAGPLGVSLHNLYALVTLALGVVLLGSLNYGFLQKQKQS